MKLENEQLLIETNTFRAVFFGSMETLLIAMNEMAKQPHTRPKDGNFPNQLLRYADYVYCKRTSRFLKEREVGAKFANNILEKAGY